MKEWHNPKGMGENPPDWFMAPYPNGCEGKFVRLEVMPGKSKIKTTDAPSIIREDGTIDDGVRWGYVTSVHQNEVPLPADLPSEYAGKRPIGITVILAAHTNPGEDDLSITPTPGDIYEWRVYNVERITRLIMYEDLHEVPTLLITFMLSLRNSSVYGSKEYPEMSMHEIT